MSSASSDSLSFTCPQCQKKLKAPTSLAGQKLNCPKCSSPIRVPGVVAVDNQDDDWLSLDSPAPKQASPSTPKPAKPATPAPVAAKAAEAPTPEAVENAKDPAISELDDFQLAPLEQKPSSPASTPAKSTGNAIDPMMVKRSVFDDDLPDLSPVAETPQPAPQQDSAQSSSKPAQGNVPKKTTGKPSQAVPPTDPFASNSGLPGMELPDIPLAPLESIRPPTSKPTSSNTGGKPLLVGSLEELSLESPALGDFALPKDEEFRFPCKVCGTFLYAAASRVGQKTRCPDCYSEFSIPSPPVKKKQQEIKLEEGPGVSFAPIDSQSARVQESSKQKSDELLDKAAEAVDKERQELDDLSGTFDSKRWMGLIFGFFKDPMVVTITIVLGIITGAWLFGVSAVGSMLGLEPTPALLARIAVFGVFCVPIFTAICMCGLAILPMAANRASKVQEWPMSRLGEAFGECMMVVATLIASSIPGGMIGALTNTLGAHPLVTIGFIMIGIWALSPILLLCMIENSSIFEPYSKAVVASTKSFADAWGAMYMQSAMAFTAIWALIGLAFAKDPYGDAVLGLMLPLLCFFIFNQYGVLAGRISGVTEMGFEGDFSDD